jgi:hypothetical protein
LSWSDGAVEFQGSNLSVFHACWMKSKWLHLLVVVNHKWTEANRVWCKVNECTLSTTTWFVYMHLVLLRYNHYWIRSSCDWFIASI